MYSEIADAVAEEGFWKVRRPISDPPEAIYLHATANVLA